MVDALRLLGHDVLTIADLGKAGQSLADEAVLSLASADQRALIALNGKHFKPPIA